MPQFVTEVISTKIAWEAEIPFEIPLVTPILRTVLRVALFSGLMASNAELLVNLFGAFGIQPLTDIANAVNDISRVYPDTCIFASSIVDKIPALATVNHLMEKVPHGSTILQIPSDFYFYAISLIHSPTIKSWQIFQGLDARTGHNVSSVAIPICFAIGIYAVSKISQKMSGNSG